MKGKLDKTKLVKEISRERIGKVPGVRVRADKRKKKMRERVDDDQ